MLYCSLVDINLPAYMLEFFLILNNLCHIAYKLNMCFVCKILTCLVTTNYSWQYNISHVSHVINGHANLISTTRKQEYVFVHVWKNYAVYAWMCVHV